MGGGHLNYQQIYGLVLEGKPFEEIAVITGLSIPELKTALPAVYKQINEFYEEQAPNIAAINFARYERMIEAVMSKLTNDVDPRILVNLSKSLISLQEAQEKLKEAMKTNRIVMPPMETPKKQEVITTPTEQKQSAFLDRYSQHMGNLSPGERSLLGRMREVDTDDDDEI